MTMETPRWQRKHETDPPATVSVIRTLPEGAWTVHSENWTVPEGSGEKYTTIEQAMAAADRTVAAHAPHDCDRTHCSKWMPVPPTLPDV
jgi:hypothetical protein